MGRFNQRVKNLQLKLAGINPGDLIHSIVITVNNIVAKSC